MARPSDYNGRRFAAVPPIKLGKKRSKADATGPGFARSVAASPAAVAKGKAQIDDRRRAPKEIAARTHARAIDPYDPSLPLRRKVPRPPIRVGGRR